MGTCCSTPNQGQVVQPTARPQTQQGRGQPVLLQQSSSAANSTKAEQLKGDKGNNNSPAEAPVVEDEPLGQISMKDFLQRVGALQPQEDRSSASKVQVLTYNMYWWSLYGQRGGENRSASKLVAAAEADIIGCQECDDITRVLHEGALQAVYGAFQGPHSLGIAYKKSTFELLGKGSSDIATDESEQFYGRRSVQWARLQHKQSGKVVFFANHHGPLRVNSGGRHGGPETASNIVKEIYHSAQPGDVVILVGDFNAQAGSQTIRELERYIPRAYAGTAQGGIDHFFSRQPMVASENLGPGGSDHDALSATFLL